MFLVVAGFFRFFLIKSTDYQTHASEWGIHWNFFSTIALINTFMVVLRDSKQALLYAFILMIAYEFYSIKNNLMEYVFYAPRDDFLSANREGVFSIPGYLSIQFIGIGLGRFLYVQMVDKNEKKSLAAGKIHEEKEEHGPQGQAEKLSQIRRKEIKLVVKVIIVQAILILAYFCSKHSFGPISRRMCNLSYVLNTCSLAWCQLLTWVLNDRLLLTNEENMVESSIAYH